MREDRVGLQALAPGTRLDAQVRNEFWGFCCCAELVRTCCMILTYWRQATFMHQNDRITCWSDSAPPLVSPLTELQQARKEVDFRIDVHSLLPVVKNGTFYGGGGVGVGVGGLFRLAVTYIFVLNGKCFWEVSLIKRHRSVLWW